MSKHTPGPLFAFKDDVGIAWHVSNNEDDCDDCQDYVRTCRTTDGPNAAADARLYAAAPDLLDSCKALLIKTLADTPDGTLSVQSIRDARALMKAAIAKAEGRAW